MQKPSELFIFFLVLDEVLPPSYYIFDRTLRDLGFFLVPVKVDQLQSLASTSEQGQIVVLSSVTDSREYKLYNDKLRGLLKYLLKSRKITYLQLSSFSLMNETRQFALTKNYFFLKFPLDARVLSARIARYYEEKTQQSTRWPGGTRAGIKNMAV